MKEEKGGGVALYYKRSLPESFVIRPETRNILLTSPSYILTTQQKSD